jgi:beta-glucosidase
MTDDERFSLVISVLGAVPGSTGFERVQLQPGESQRVALSADPRLLARFDGSIGAWRIAEGSYAVAVGRSAASLDLTASTALGGATFGV